MHELPLVLVFAQVHITQAIASENETKRSMKLRSLKLTPPEIRSLKLTPPEIKSNKINAKKIALISWNDTSQINLNG